MALAAPIFPRANIEVLARAQLPTRFGVFQVVSFVRGDRPFDDVAILNGPVSAAATAQARIHSECLTGDALGSTRCDCRDQLELSLDRLARVSGSVLLYLRQEGRGIGIAKKVEAYSLQDAGLDTVEANLHLGFDDDLRSYGNAAGMLLALGIGDVELHTNNPRKVFGLAEHGIKVHSRVPLVTEVRAENLRYLAVKRSKSGHLL